MPVAEETCCLLDLVWPPSLKIPHLRPCANDSPEVIQGTGRPRLDTGMELMSVYSLLTQLKQ